jgi:hypothetical protein
MSYYLYQFTMPYTEKILVQQTTIDYLKKEFGWKLP